MIARSKTSASLIVCAGFAAWLGGAGFIGIKDAWGFAAVALVGAGCFLIVACFLPEARRTTFLVRKSALGLAAGLVWVATNHLISSKKISFADFVDPEWNSLLSLAVPILFASVVYGTSIFLIRGFHARPPYEKEERDACERL